MDRRRWLAGVLAVVGACALAAPPSARAATGDTLPGAAGTADSGPTTTLPGPDVTDAVTGLPVARGPLVVLPAGCVTPPAAAAVFEGTLTAAVSTTARFKVRRVLAGSLGSDQVGGQADVRYGDETRFLSIGSTYIVGVSRPATGGLFSTVREPAPLFAGDAVVGANNSDIACPLVNDPIRTLLLDGTPVDTGVLAPLHGHGKRLLLAVLEPILIAFAVLLGLVLVKHLVFATGRAMRDVADSMSEQREPTRQR
jgi:hypothetical protein